jgi:hypothetical protein
MSKKLAREPISQVGEATDAPPGSPRKIRVLMERASRREALFHPQDNLKRRLPNSPPEPELEGNEADLLEMDMDEDMDMDIDLAG